MADLASLRLNSIWVAQHILISAPPIATIRDQTGECFCFLQTAVTECLSHQEEGGVQSGDRIYRNLTHQRGRMVFCAYLKQQYGQMVRL